MSKAITQVIIICLLMGCSSQHYIQKADFNSAINVSAKKIRKDRSNTHEIENLKYAYSKANEIDYDRIEYLFDAHEDNMWDEVHRRYTYLYNRQEIVKTLPNEVLDQIDFEYKNYAEKITKSKQNAADYYYQNGLSLLSTRDKYDARQAYNNFLRAQKYYKNYKDVNNLIKVAKYNGTNQVLFLVKNHTDMIMPETFEDEILKISLSNLNKNWVNYDTRVVEKKQYDYYIQLSLKQIITTPEEVHKSSFVESREIEDGFKYLLDRNGNVKKDSIGNDIKIPVYRVIECKVVETVQLKKVDVIGTIDYINTINNQLIKTENIGAATIFEHHSAQAHGNVKALKPATRKIIGTLPLPFPSYPQMILDAASILKDNSKVIINKNYRLVSK